ncbi:oxidoreductase [Actinorhabdospora filicis]|uniref:Oxidoreductase n=1 Tax=Actinorhabdospora filicis TaxID=1785913 RepID=A0A9W6WA52_9ACTN|nr:SDR family oxidoreductase [Actinorhabdospora filicis]GLZ79294.1 oxidoreductase [Actinorhabdospora filicis]
MSELSSRFSGRRAFVTGGGRGIGRAITARLIAEGAEVVIGEIDDGAGRATAAELGAHYLHCDVTDAGSVAGAVAEAAAGGLDVLVNNVGLAGHGFFDELAEEDWTRRWDATLMGAVRCMRAAFPHLLASPVGNVVTIGSINGMEAFGDAPYSAAKAGLQSLTQNLAVEYSPRMRRERGLPGHVRVNLVAPGSIRTRAWEPEIIDAVGERYPMARAGEPEDIAAAVAFLASPDASWITGLILPVDGGLTADGRLFTLADV